MENDARMDLQMKPAEVVIIKGDIKIVNPKNDLEFFFYFGFRKEM